MLIHCEACLALDHSGERLSMYVWVNSSNVCGVSEVLVLGRPFESIIAIRSLLQSARAAFNDTVATSASFRSIRRLVTGCRTRHTHVFLPLFRTFKYKQLPSLYKPGWLYDRMFLGLNFTLRLHKGCRKNGPYKKPY